MMRRRSAGRKSASEWVSPERSLRFTDMHHLRTIEYRRREVSQVRRGDDRLDLAGDEPNDRFASRLVKLAHDIVEQQQRWAAENISEEKLTELEEIIVLSEFQINRENGGSPDQIDHQYTPETGDLYRETAWETDAFDAANVFVVQCSNPDLEEPLTAVSAILDKTGLQAKVAQLSSSPAGLALQVNRLYPDEFESLADEIRKSGLTVKTAEVRLLEARRDGRLLNAALTIEGETE